MFVLSRQETQLIEALPFPSHLAGKRREILELKYRVDGVMEDVLRDVRGSPAPAATWEQERGRIATVASQVDARFDELGLHYCAQ
jgi:hypothetical protein